VNGKARIPDALHYLKNFNVRVAAIVDFDLLNDRQLMEKAVKMAGGDWSVFDADFAALHSAVDRLGVTIQTVDTIRTEVNRILSSCTGKQGIPDVAADSIKELLKERSAWRNLKLSGVAGVPGEAGPSTERIVANLSTLGVFVLPVGEVERWYKLDVRKQRWVEEVLDKSHHLSRNEELTKFLSSINAHLAT
jgi:hypothetical protein